MSFLHHQYELTTTKSKQDILATARGKVKTQEGKSNFWGLDLVNYKNFKVSDNLIEVESWPMTRVNPYEGIGTILFELTENGKGTNIKCTIKPYSKYALLVGSCFFTFIIILTFTFVLIAFHGELLKILIALSIVTLFLGGTSYLSILYYKNVLHSYSETILRDLDINFTRAK